MDEKRFKEMDIDFLIKLVIAPKKVREEAMKKVNEGYRALLGEKAKIFSKLIQDNKITSEEIKDFQDDFYVEYLNMVAFAKPPTPEDGIIMITCNDDLLANRDKLFKKFGIPVKTIQELMTEKKNEEDMGKERS